MALTIVAKIKAKPEGVDQLVTALKAVAIPSREEAGCESYQLYLNPDDPTDLVMVETWADNDAIATHNKSPHFQALVADMTPLLAGPLDIQILKPAKDA
ncbi:MAG: antibiotic biosynthesis monooxygenase [Amycolatopsis sp.]|jgi:quinol monooxygenase YgiN|uniref:putative quinol monooxygenase n=1 Tax=Amycolatopsis sp. TaxID=37632 RepID=UPI00261555A9|nr:putative quinol monooxygenase [Amycolatopsis sp.]MCU1683791.1 antibiotic biosynthesis monooxygenase [Amycolatopsis sp.]